MRHLTVMTATIVVVLSAGASSQAGVLSRAELKGANAPTFQYVQDRQERRGTVGQRVKRAWKNLVGYQFDVACPIPIPFSHSTCSETGRGRSDARAKCESRNPFCYVNDVR